MDQLLDHESFTHPAGAKQNGRAAYAEVQSQGFERLKVDPPRMSGFGNGLCCVVPPGVVPLYTALDILFPDRLHVHTSEK
jgi:hypothetical protein